jgi:hypothetical protein
LHINTLNTTSILRHRKYTYIPKNLGHKGFVKATEEIQKYFHGIAVFATLYLHFEWPFGLISKYLMDNILEWFYKLRHILCENISFRIGLYAMSFVHFYD